ncbi:MAG TPA: hypothetical protein VF832_07775 [Longimicrobiales bacterium]
MKISFLPLFTLAVTHGYYGGPTEDFHYAIPTGSGATLRRGRLLAREREGVLSVLFEADDAGAPLASVAGDTIRVGLQLANPYFSNFTVLPGDFPATKLRWSNAANPVQLAAEPGVRFAGEPLLHALSGSAPLTVTLRAAGGTVLQTQSLAAGDTRDAVSFLLTGYAPGAYQVVETGGAGSSTRWYYLDDELAAADPAAVVEITVGAGFYGNPPAFQVPFSERQETLCYYVVARNYSAQEMNQLSVADQGAAADGRPAIAFATVQPAAFGAGELPATLAGPGERLVLFRSTGLVPRRARGRHRIELSKNGTVLNANLPQPGADRPAADLIVHLSKP